MTLKWGPKVGSIERAALYSLQLRLVVLEHLLQEVDALLGPDLVHPDEVLGRGQLQVLPLLVQLVRDLTGRDLRAVQPCKTKKRLPS